MKPASEYHLTDAGKEYLVAKAQWNAFCTGKYVLLEVENFTEPADAMGMKLSQVNFRYKLTGAADWVKTESLGVAYKDFAKRAQDDIQDKAALVLTNDGWMHERLFK
ncbi:MAG: hypothetical protein FWD46_02370 [Cystobacterineae bacterium]|nr:hypothetical protein [Cystobacterineae bacterium]